MSRNIIVANKTFRYVIIFLVTNFFSFICYAQQSDIDFIYEQILENHPGIYNKLDPEFELNLKQEYSKANKLLDKNSDPIKQQSIITSFAKSFDDSQLRVRWYQEQ